MPISEVKNIDCMIAMKEFPDKFFDLAIVDPPYGIGNVNQKRSRNFHDKKISDWNRIAPNHEYFAGLFRISKNQIIWGVNYFAELVPHHGRIIHDKDPFDRQLDELSTADIASHSFGNNVKVFRYEWRGNVQNGSVNWKNTGIDARIHPTQKPVALYKWLLKNYTKEGDKILDTHLGSGSSRIAAYDMCFDFYGFELDKDYFDASVKRFNEFKAQQKLFA